MSPPIMFPIKEYEGLYSITRNGRIYSHKKLHGTRLRKGNWISARLDKYGYLKVTLHNNKKRKSFFIHRLVAQTFIKNTNNYPQVNHINGIKTDNSFDNLEWCTGKQNIQHGYSTGLIPKTPHMFSYTQIEEIYKLRSSGLKKIQLARMFNCSRQLIYKILKGEYKGGAKLIAPLMVLCFLIV